MGIKSKDPPSWMHAAFMVGPIEDLLKSAAPVLARMCKDHGVTMRTLRVETGWETPTTGVHLKILMGVRLNVYKGVLEHKIPLSLLQDKNCVRDAIQVLVKQKLPAFVMQHAND